MEIQKYPSQILQEVCEEQLVFDFELAQLLDSMRTCMLDSNGLGLAANQISVSKRIFLMKTSKNEIFEFVNPKILISEGVQRIEEGCLSAPGVFVQVERPETLEIEAQTREGEKFVVLVTGLEAVIAAQEISAALGYESWDYDVDVSYVSFGYCVYGYYYLYQFFFCCR
jgi:peptide deformylase